MGIFNYREKLKKEHFLLNKEDINDLIKKYNKNVKIGLILFVPFIASWAIVSVGSLFTKDSYLTKIGFYGFVITGLVITGVGIFTVINSFNKIKKWDKEIAEAEVSYKKRKVIL